MTDTVALALIASLQVVTTGWLHYQTNKNACGGAKCVSQMGKALLKANLESSITKLGNMSGREKSQP